MKLLSAGKGLVGIREGRTKYMVTKSNLVPNFNDAGEPAKPTKAGFGRKAGRAANPFRIGGQNLDEPAARAGRLLPAPQGAGEPGEEAKPEAETPKARWVAVQGGPAVADAPAAAGARPVELSRPQRKPKGSGAVREAAEARHRPEPVLTAVERRRKPTPALVARLGKLAALAQVGRRKPAPKPDEAWLKKLKVVRNDLKDADLEVVPAKCVAADVAEAPAMGQKSRPTRGAVARFVRSRKLSRLVPAFFAWF